MYQVLARKYRPRNFIELVGQNHVSRALTSALERGRLHHAYLFTGTRGVGKTTIARILAKCLNCETGVTSTPCEVCATCTAVNEGRFIDLIEIDAASRTKVEDTRELLDNVPYAPTQGRYKVYLIDEVHMLSTHSFNALLKTLEEPPEHVKFLFATTDPQKLPITVISRCLQFTLRPLAVDEITSHLSHILNQEDITAEQDAIWQIAESAQGSLRDALSLTDQAIAYGQGSIQHQDVKEMLGLIDRTIIFDLILAIHQNQQQHVSALLMQFRQQALDVSLVLDQFISTLHELALLQYLPDLSLKYSAEINAKIMQLSAIISAQDLQLYYQVACKGRAELQLAVTQEQGFEMCVLRLLAFRPMQSNETFVQKNTHVTSDFSQIAQQNVTSESQLSSQQTSQVDATQVISNPESLDKQIRHQENQQRSNQDLKDSQADSKISERLSTQNTVAPHEKQTIEDIQSHTQLPSTNNDEYSSFDLEDDSNIDATLQQHTLEHEPSSDDYLDDELDVDHVGSVEQVEITENASTFDSNQSIQTANNAVSNIDTSQREEALLIDKDPIFHSNSIESKQNREAPGLSFFGDEPEKTKEPLTAIVDSDQEVFFLNPEDVKGSLTKTTLIVEENESVNALASRAALYPSPQIDSQSQSSSKLSKKGLMPQDILALSVQKLEGEWSVDKWEYWFRNSDLSPAVQELAQQGVMTGIIDGDSTFLIPEKYESILTQFQHTLENEIKNRWSNTKFNVCYQEVSEQTPFAKQAERKERAYSRATELLSNEDAVKSLMALFEGEIHNVQLK